MKTTIDQPKVKSASWRSKKFWDWAAEWKGLFTDILPEHVCEAAMATCRFELRGLNANGNEWGVGFLTHMQTFGEIPSGLIERGLGVQRKHWWIELNAHESANIILACFGLTVDDVFAFAGYPEPGERKVVDLCEVVCGVNPEFNMTTNNAAALAA